MDLKLSSNGVVVHEIGSGEYFNGNVLREG